MLKYRLSRHQATGTASVTLLESKTSNLSTFAIDVYQLMHFFLVIWRNWSDKSYDCCKSYLMIISWYACDYMYIDLTIVLWNTAQVLTGGKGTWRLLVYIYIVLLGKGSVNQPPPSPHYYLCSSDGFFFFEFSSISAFFHSTSSRDWMNI